MLSDVGLKYCITSHNINCYENIRKPEKLVHGLHQYLNNLTR